MSDANVNDSPDSISRRLISLLGDDVVLLPIPQGMKGPRLPEWQKFRADKMKDPDYVRCLNRAYAISASLGEASGGLCSIDIDDDESVEPFLALNPKLRQTLRSRGKRGCNLWVRTEGDYPSVSPIKRPDGKAWGEWRSTGASTTLHGNHPEGVTYERSPEVPPITMRFDEIVWPSGFLLPWLMPHREQIPPREDLPKWTKDQMREMLAFIPKRPDYEQWLRISSAVWSALGEEEGTAVLCEWSPEEEDGEYDEKFKHRLHQVTAGTLVHIAKEHGWRGERPPEPEPETTRDDAVGRFYYDGNGKYHLDTGTTLVPMDQRSVIRHLRLWGFRDTPATEKEPPVEIISPMLCEIQTRRFVRKTDDIHRDGPADLLQRAYELAFDPEAHPPADELCMNLGEYPIAARGNLTCIQGKSKVGKSSVVAAILGACQRGSGDGTGDTLCFAWSGDASGSIIHLDTEQSGGDWHSLVRRSVTRSGLPSVSSRLVSIPLVRFARSERAAILQLVLERERHEQGGIDAVIIDGVADLCASPNDEAESLELVSRLHALSQEYATPIFCVLHENPAGEGKTRGHLGSELNRKAFANLRIDKDAETSLSTMWGMDMRKRDIPQNQGFCFAWDEEAGMHTFQGRAAGIKAAKREQKATEEAREKWENIFEFVAENGTKSACPVLSADEAASAIQDMNGTKTKPRTDTVKKQMQRAEELGVLRKAGRGRWTLNRWGQAGHERDK